MVFLVVGQMDFFLASSDGRFKLNIGGVIQERYVLNYNRAGNPPFEPTGGEVRIGKHKNTAQYQRSYF